MATSRSSQKSNTSKTKVLKRLQHDFETLRKRKRRSKHIPQTLRQAVLTAVEDGISDPEIRRACGVTSAQLKQWGSEGRTPRKDPSSVGTQADVRILRVIEDPEQGKAKNDGVQLELKVGQCRISIQWG